MSRVMNWTRVATLLVLAGAVAGCEPEVDVLGTKPPSGGEMFTRYVALGNSITAGWQSGGINDSLQKRSYASLLAARMGTRFAYPAFAGFGCPAPVANFISGKAIDSLVPPAQKQACYLRSSASATEQLNNLAVPYAYAIDLTTVSASPEGRSLIPGNPLWTFILGGKSVVQKAIDVDPTFATLWVGNNELLFPATYGLLNGPAVGVSAPPLIPFPNWRPMYAAAVDALVAGAPNLEGGVLIGVVDVTNIPRFFPVDSLVTRPTLKAQFDAAAGRTVTILPGCGASGLLVSIELLFQIRAGTHPAVISCVKNVPQAPIGDIFMLDAAELAAIRGTAAQYNAYIQAKADSIGFAYLNPNVRLGELRASGDIPLLPALNNRTAPFGAYFSLDGAHPSNTAHQLIAQLLAQAINAKYGTTLPAGP